MLTDPTTGRVLDDTALTYEPDRATRIAVRGKWQTCTAPGCSRPAVECEIDHGIPFNHHQPELGGRTEPANLHPLCKRHHQAKTEGRLRMRRTTADEIEWIMSIGTTDTTVAPSVDDGGILSDACAVEDSPERAEARRVMRERVVTDPLTGADAADAVLAGAWRELQEEEAKRERRYAEQAAARSVREAALEAEWQRVKAWPAEERVRLEEWEARLGRRSLDVARRDERVTRDERLVSLLRADVERRRQDLRTRQQSAPQQSVPHQSVSQQSQNQQSVSRQSVSQRTEDPPEGDQSAAPSKRGESSIAMRTIIPMTTTVYEYERGVTSSLHSPLFGSRAQRAARRGEIDELAATYDEARQSGECEPGGREPGDRESGEFTSGENSVRGPRSTGKLARSASVIEDRLATELHDRMADRVPDLVVSFGQIPPADATPPWPEELRRRMASLRGDSTDPPSDPPDSHKPQDSGTTHDFRESYDSREPQDSGTAAEENDPPPF